MVKKDCPVEIARPWNETDAKRFWNKHVTINRPRCQKNTLPARRKRPLNECIIDLTHEDYGVCPTRWNDGIALADLIARQLTARASTKTSGQTHLTRIKWPGNQVFF